MWNGGTSAWSITGSTSNWSTNGPSTASYPFPLHSTRHRSKAERRFEEELAKLKGNVAKLEHQLRLQEATRKAASDKASRAHRPHPVTRKDLGRRLQTYDAAMAVRAASRRPSP